MAKDLKDLQKKDTVQPAAVKEKKEKTDPAELKAQRIANLKPRVKDPEKAAQDEKIKAHITQLLTATPEGLTAKVMRAAIFEGSAESEFAKEEKRIRFIARDMGCVRTPIEGSRQKIYKLPQA